jgi:hypothetical protein
MATSRCSVCPVDPHAELPLQAALTGVKSDSELLGRRPRQLARDAPTAEVPGPAQGASFTTRERPAREVAIGDRPRWINAPLLQPLEAPGLGDVHCAWVKLIERDPPYFEAYASSASVPWTRPAAQGYKPKRAKLRSPSRRWTTKSCTSRSLELGCLCAHYPIRRAGGDCGTNPPISPIPHISKPLHFPKRTHC